MIDVGKYSLFTFEDLVPDTRFEMLKSILENTFNTQLSDGIKEDSVKLTDDGIEITYKWPKEAIRESYKDMFFTKSGFHLSELDPNNLTESEITDEIRYQRQNGLTEEDAASLIRQNHVERKAHLKALTEFNEDEYYKMVYEEGVQAGKAKFETLIAAILKEDPDNYDDVIKVIDDIEYRKRMYEKYNI